MKPDRFLIKIGGSIAEKNKTLLEIADALADIWAAGNRLVLVHGGGGDISRNLELLDESPEFMDGLRVTSPRIMDMVEMTLSGYVNKKIAGFLNRQGENRGIRAVGISGVDAATLVCVPVSEKLGRVGRIDRVYTGLIENLLNGGFLPVVSPVSVDEHFAHYNVNADEAASALASALRVDKLIFLSGVPGVLDEKGEAVLSLDAGQIGPFIKKGIASGGMIPKLKACLSVMEEGVKEIHICGWENKARFMEQISGSGKSGTVIRGKQIVESKK